MIAEPDPLGIFLTAYRTLVKRQRGSAIIAELPRSRRFATRRTDGGLTLQFALPDRRGLCCFLDIALQGSRACFGNRHLLAWRARDAHSLILVMARIAHILLTCRTPVKMALRLVLRMLERPLVFLLPFGRLPVETFGQDIAPMRGRPTDIAHPPTDKTSQNVRALAERTQPLATLVGLALYKTRFEPVLTVITVECELESGFGGIICIVACECL